MSTSTEDTTPTTSLTQLRPGDVIEARKAGSLLVYQGEVDHIAPQRGVLWIRYGPFNERKLLDASEYQIYQRPASVPPARRETRQDRDVSK